MLFAVYEQIEQITDWALAFIMKCLAVHTCINQCFFAGSHWRRRHLTEPISKLPKVEPIVPADLMEEHLCEVIMEMAAAEVGKSTTRTPGLIHSLHTSILVFLLMVCQGIIVGHPRPQWEAGFRLRDRKTFGEVHPHPQTRTVTRLMGIHHPHKTSSVDLHHPHPHPTITTMGITTVITEINPQIRIITVHLMMVGMVLTTGMAGSGMMR